MNGTAGFGRDNKTKLIKSYKNRKVLEALINNVLKEKRYIYFQWKYHISLWHNYV